MACVRRRRDKWVLDYRDHTGARRWQAFRTKAAANAALADVVLGARSAARPACDPRITVGAYAERWLRLMEPLIKPSTWRSDEGALRLHVPAALKTLRVRQLGRGHVRALLTELLGQDLARNTVRIVHATVRTMLNAAVDDGVIASNPADRLG